MVCMPRVLPRTYDSAIASHLAADRQMVFVSGPRQVGKTTTCRVHGTHYLDWDNEDHRSVVLAGPAAVADHVGLERLRAERPVVVFDEIHKHGRWKSFLKGLFDTYADRMRIVVTGSSRLDVYRRGGDSLVGRYFLYRMHPFTVAELRSPPGSPELVREPGRIRNAAFTALRDHGGYPEPHLKRDTRFTNRWRRTRQQLLLREDVRDLTRVQELGQIQALGTLLASRSAGQVIYSNLAREVKVSVDTMRRWVDVLCGLHWGFLVRPWHRNVEKALRKEPKWFLRDWSGIRDPGARAETFVACHLLKAVEWWTDTGLGAFELRYVRDKQKREVDFLVVRDDEPWFLVEAKAGAGSLSPALPYFQEQTGAPHAFQVALDLPYVDADCFAHEEPVIVPARTFLSQLV